MGRLSRTRARIRAQVIDHAETTFRKTSTRNRIENFWSLLKRGLKGTYVSVEPFHLFRYLDEQAYRYNYRKLDDGQRFIGVAGSVLGRRVTYSELTGNTESTAEPLPGRQWRGKRHRGRLSAVKSKSKVEDLRFEPKTAFNRLRELHAAFCRTQKRSKHDKNNRTRNRPLARVPTRKNP